MTDRTYAEHMKQAAASRRADFIEGVRALADLLADEPDIPLPYDGQIYGRSRGWHLATGGDNPAAADRLATLLGRPAGYEIRGEAIWLTWHICGLAIMTSAPIGVCEQVTTRVVRVGDREVPTIEYVVPARFQPEQDEAAR